MKSRMSTVSTVFLYCLSLSLLSVSLLDFFSSSPTEAESQQAARESLYLLTLTLALSLSSSPTNATTRLPLTVFSLLSFTIFSCPLSVCLLSVFSSSLSRFSST
ncbi:uncharacterized protein ARB_00446 [Trichophyton benhamiae CBS 112371]|uniref:Uncharacterized protein n=1 Tax=Arthroderma benhamiae (strain ATCC MYA-4681 / CBS 112371) TaxID=663331 RepID=D4AW81_ARTBC|nr:uncharacterized protein ARB_00446 [Trichophyton benhamiae CBS 112371]EFE32621.1 hypothetical protein ARB_00446 [Trichophyton benhamiae CBS 112371]